MDKFSAFDDDDLERDFNLLGESSFQRENFRLRIVSLFPAWFYEFLGIPFRLAEGLQLHFFFMRLFLINGIAYVLYLAISGEWRATLPVHGSFKRAMLVTLHDAHR
ncbi:MAG: hypothetical protein ACR2N3_16930 [Pyrinomonadaceae bacterium]